MLDSREILHHIYRGFLDSIGVPKSETDSSRLKSYLKKRSMSMSRLYEQLWGQLYQMDEWAYPLDIYVGDNGSDIFSIVAQSGKLYQVPLSVSQETVTMGEWLQVKEEFAPITQQRKSRFFIRRQRDGKYRWTAIAATSVLNRVAQIDSTKLFDCFVEQANKRNKYARLDFYHWGETDPAVWEFGTADFVARDGVCYLASGLFDEDHPLAKATIRACEAGEHEWGCSIEFYSYAEPEKIILDPEVVIPVYNEGENTRISVVLEEDAAGLFTRMNVLEGVKRTMDAKTRESLEKLYGGDTDGLQAFLDQFEEGVDSTNKRVKNDKLIHRTVAADADLIGEVVDVDVEGEEEIEQTEEGDDSPELVLDDAAVAALSETMLESGAFRSLMDDIRELKQLVSVSIVDREKSQREIAKLQEDNAKLSKAVERLNAGEKSEYLQDLPSRKRQVVTYRPSVNRNLDEDGEPFVGDEFESSDTIANRTLSKLKFAY